MRWLRRNGDRKTAGEAVSTDKTSPALGILWAIENVASAGYGLESWKIFWRVVPAQRLAGATLYEGDTDSTLRGGQRLYCIGLGHPSAAVPGDIREMLDESAEYRLVSASSLNISDPTPNFLEGEALAREPLVEMGWVDPNGQVAGEGWAAPAFEAVSSEPTDVDGLIVALRDLDDGLRNHAALALGDLGDARAVDPLIQALEDEAAGFRRRVITSLGKLKDSRAAAPIIRALDDADWRVRLQAAGALGELADRRAVETLIGALADENVYVRGLAAQSLGVLGDPRAVGPLAAALGDEESYVRVGADLALGWIGGPEAEEALRAHRKSL